jgi:hypothetical protein
VHLGWTLMTVGLASHALPDARIVLAASVFIALAKPGMNWIIEGRKALDKLDAERAAREQAQELERTRAQDRALAASRDSGGQKTRQRGTSAAGAWVPKVVAAVAAASLGAPQDAAAEAGPVQPVTHSRDASMTQVADASASVDEAPPAKRVKRVVRQKQKQQDAYEAARQRAREMLRETHPLSNRAIARETGLSPSTVDRMAREMTPLAA